MEKQGVTATSKPLGMCEKIFNALKIPILRPRRRISYGPEAVAPRASPKPPAAAGSGGQITKVESKLPTPVKPEPLQGGKKITEVAPPPVPMQPPITEERKKQAQSGERQAAMVASKIEPVPVQGKEKLESAPPTSATVGGQGRPKVSTNPVPPPTQIQVKEKASGKASTAPAGGGADGKAAKVEPMPLPAPKPDKERAATRGTIENINERVVDYINRAKVRLRADSSVGRTGKGASG